MKLLIAVHDMMFSSRIASVVKGQDVTWLPRGTSLVDKAREVKPDAIVLDLGNAALKPLESVQAIKADEALKGAHVIAFVGHTEQQLIEGAKAAGIDELYSKGEFNRALATLLGGKS